VLRKIAADCRNTGNKTSNAQYPTRYLGTACRTQPIKKEDRSVGAPASGNSLDHPTIPVCVVAGDKEDVGGRYWSRWGRQMLVGSTDRKNSQYR
jgi:hypothetical protein